MITKKTKNEHPGHLVINPHGYRSWCKWCMKYTDVYVECDGTYEQPKK